MKKHREIKIAIIGLGYVGLPLAIEFSKFFKTVGYDKNQERITDLKNNNDKTLEVTSEELKKTRLNLTSKISEIKCSNIFIITVPTPVDKNKKPDLSFLSSASRTVAKLIKIEDVVIYESTVYPGVTEDYCVPILEKYSNLKYNKDFFCGYSPERINPGDKTHTLTKITKITSGSNEKISIFIENLYKTIISAGVYRAPSIAVAEAAKVIENTQRDVNIALMNELAIIFKKLKLDTSEILKAAGTKWNFLPFQPGLVGGHCIGVDPYYLTHKALEIGYKPEMIIAGRKINDGMGRYFADNIIEELKNNGLSPENSKIGIFGLTFKEDCPDLRNSKVIDMIKILNLKNCKLFITDPIADKNIAKNLFNLEILDLNEISQMDLVVLAVGHKQFKEIKLSDWRKILNKKSLIFDIKSIYSSDYFKDKGMKHIRV